MKIEESKEQLIKKIEELKSELTLLKEKDALRVHTENALLRNKKTASAYMNATSDLSVLIDVNGLILEINEAATRRVGKSVSELLGKCLFDFFPDDFAEFRRVYINIVKQTKEPMHYQDQYLGLVFNVCIYPIMDSQDEVERIAVFINDETEHRKNEELLYRYSQILSTVHDPMFYIDKSFIFRMVNDAFLKIYKKKQDEIIGKTVEEIIGKKFFDEKIKANIESCLQGQLVQQQEWFEYPDGLRLFMFMSFYPLLSKDNRVIGVVINSTDITKNKQLEDELKRLSITDRLTQINNRVKFDQAMGEEVKRSKRYNTDLALIMFDIDHFKHVNDTYGHDVGDKVLVTLVQLVKKCIRETDIFARWGGEEFMLLLPHTNLENTSKLAERIRARLEQTPVETVGKITCSFGVSQFLPEDDEETFLKRVDNALYESKKTGRNKVTVK